MAQGRRVRRVIRRVDTWSVVRVAALFHVSMVAVLLLAAVLLWLAGRTVGAIDNIEGFMQAVGFDGFRFVPGQLLRAAVLLGSLSVVLFTGYTVLLAVIYNLISDVVGGIELTVLEEERPERRPTIVLDDEVAPLEDPLLERAERV